MKFGIFLQAQPGGDYTFLFFMAFMFIVLYFFMIRPQQKKQKEAKKFRENIKKGDTIVTIGGIHAKVISVGQDESVMAEIDNGVHVKVEKWAISSDATKKTEPSTK